MEANINAFEMDYMNIERRRPELEQLHEKINQVLSEKKQRLEIRSILTIKKHMNRIIEDFNGINKQCLS